MNIEVLRCAINDLKEIIISIENKDSIKKCEYVKLEKEVHSFLSNLSSYKFHCNIKSNKLLSAFQYAFNMTKHEKKVAKVDIVNKGGFSFPISFPFSIPSNEIFWVNVDSLKPEVEYKNQYNNYRCELADKRIIETLKRLEIEILNK